MLSISRIVVGVDFTAPSLRALDDAIELAARVHASVIVVHVIERPAVFPEELSSDVELPNRITAAEGALRAIIRERRDQHVALAPVLRVGKAWHEIEAVADEQDADLIVLGIATDRHGLLSTLLGDNVAATVVRTAHKPVLTIRSPERLPV
jgi:nucleotide-binding universal stress UspA family protein